LVKRMEDTNLVEIKGNGTDLSFSIKGMNAIKCSGEVNIPDGEIFTAPVKDSVQGHIQFNTKTEYFGTVFDQVYLAFKDGKIITAESSSSDRLNQILDTDEGSRYIGEFAIGVNPFILEPMLDTLFDEKICGSFHFTPGNAYDEADNGNKSKVHWDLVNIQRAEHGGGEIYFDGELIRKDGLFVVDDLIGLNPDFLK
jgi:aminopeptidase